MWKLTLRNLAANKGRLALTGLAIVLGVGFVVASFITSDGLRDSFGSLSKEIVGGTDLTIRQTDDFANTTQLDESTLAAVNAVDGVAVAEGQVAGFVQPITPAGEPISANGPPLIGFSWVGDPGLNLSAIVEGAAPGPGQFVLDVDAAANHEFIVGETYTLVNPNGSVDYELSGLHRFGEDNQLLGATLMGFNLDDARILFGSDAGTFDEIIVRLDDGADTQELQAAVGGVLPAGLETVNSQTLEQETAGDFNSAISIIRNIFLGFAGVSLFVSIFIIYNTFGVVLAQRVREIGLLRAVGATPRQIRRSIVTEATLLGLGASIIGVGAGVAIHKGLLAAFDAIGAGLPPTDLIVAPRTIAVALGIGVGATMVSALLPAFRAASISPIAALSGLTASTQRQRRLISGFGVVMLVVGLALGAVGFQGLGGTTMIVAALAGGAMLVFLAVTILSPLATGPVINVLAKPLGLIAGTAGELARKNAVRHPGRTATTAASLMIGLALITTALVVGDSFKSQISTTLDTATSADYLISDSAFIGFPADFAAQVEVAPELGTVMESTDVRVRLPAVWADEATAAGDAAQSATAESDREQWYGVAELDELGALFDLGIDRGSLETDVANAVILPTNEADDLAVSVGDTIDIEFDNGIVAAFEVVATFTDQTVIDGAFLDLSAAKQYIDIPSYEWIAADVADGVTAKEAEAAMTALTADYPQLQVQDSAEYRESIAAEIDSMMNAIAMMLALAIVIALMGIGLTLALSIVERTREIGLLRAVGMTRRQTRRMIRWESAAIAAFGAVLGIATGLVFGWGVVTAIPDTYMRVVSVPVGRLAIMVGAAIVAGLIAALLPARRAGRLNVLDAITGS